MILTSPLILTIRHTSSCAQQYPLIFQNDGVVELHRFTKAQQVYQKPYTKYTTPIYARMSPGSPALNKKYAFWPAQPSAPDLGQSGPLI